MNRLSRRLVVLLIIAANCTGCDSGKASHTLETLDADKPLRPNLTRAQVQQDFDQFSRP